MTKHTPGPWEIKRHPDSGYKFISGPKHSGLAQVVWCMEEEERSPECEANAHLIAAAPELLEALQKVFQAMNDDMPVRLRKVCYEAIAKAKGESND
jgi:hypothetical protein